jgi:hypothetical protein
LLAPRHGEFFKWRELSHRVSFLLKHSCIPAQSSR